MARSTATSAASAGNEELETAFAVARERVAKILTQKADSTDKLYALHAPEVEWIAKGTARTRYEFGAKTSIAVTVARAYGDRGYKGHRLGGKAKIYIAHTRGIASPAIKRELRRPNAILRAER